MLPNDPLHRILALKVLRESDVKFRIELYSFSLHSLPLLTTVVIHCLYSLCSVPPPGNQVPVVSPCAGTLLQTQPAREAVPILPLVERGGGAGGDPEWLPPSDNSSAIKLHVNAGREGQTLPAEFHKAVGGCLQSTFKSMIVNLSHVFLRSCPPARDVLLCLVEGEVEVRVNFLRQQIHLCRNILEKVMQAMTLQRGLRTDSWLVALPFRNNF
ncbi:unnamed protein product [Dibothriocephalus latus]|uniref:Uncharacterized protein n=1 Tax=Dibothriocephalus latus TaxID=60516 RepID=A0A3P7MX64_DIBLA|nr:unnamed protein product [Dibothriocephalus latus]